MQQTDYNYDMALLIVTNKITRDHNPVAWRSAGAYNAAAAQPGPALTQLVHSYIIMIVRSRIRLHKAAVDE